MSLRIADWKHGKRWAYSITYDEALAELYEFAVPIHDSLGIPGHVEAVAGHVGVVRQLGQSSYNGFHHMSGAQMREMLDRGWGVGCHSWSHEIITPETVEREVGEAKTRLEEAIGAPVRLFCSPGDNTNMADHVLAACRRHGYLGAMSITDAPNWPADELFWLNRTPLHEQLYPPFYSAYDPFRNIRYAQEQGGWIIDYCHCPLAAAVHPNKDCTAEHLRLRLETVLAEGRGDVWTANPDDVIQYHLLRRHTTIREILQTDREQTYSIAISELPAAVVSRTLTFDLEVPADWPSTPAICIDGIPLIPERAADGVLRFMAEIRNGSEARISATS
jgi:hypothetical protein